MAGASTMSEINAVTYSNAVPAMRNLEPPTAAYSARVRHLHDLTRHSESHEIRLERSSLRRAKLAAVREQIALGTYETPERISGTVHRLLDVIG